jgi:hypothetical protein
VKKNLSSLPAAQLTDDVLLILSHEHSIVNHTSALVILPISSNLEQFSRLEKQIHTKAKNWQSRSAILLPKFFEKNGWFWGPNSLLRVERVWNDYATRRRNLRQIQRTV